MHSYRQQQTLVHVVQCNYLLNRNSGLHHDKNKIKISVESVNNQLTAISTQLQTRIVVSCLGLKCLVLLIIPLIQETVSEYTSYLSYPLPPAIEQFHQQL